MNIWIVSMECAGIAEAGGVKNVTFSLCNEFGKLNQNVTLFIPVYKSTSFDQIKNYQDRIIKDVVIYHCGKEEKVSFSKAESTEGNFKIVFMNHPSFEDKEGVYTYTENEHKNHPSFIKGSGHVDCLFMDSLFAKSVCEYARFIDSSLQPDIIHCQDASTALIPPYAQTSPFLKRAKSVVTIHNAGPAYHHSFSSEGEAAWYTGFDSETLVKAMNNGKVEPFLLAFNAGASFTTVSEDYAKELINPAYDRETEGLSSIFFTKKLNIQGITNGIDFERYNPTDTKISCLPYAFNPEKQDLEGKFLCKKYFVEKVLQKKSYEGVSVFGSFEKDCKIEDQIFIVYHGRIASQKGITILLESIPTILKQYPNVKFIIAGQGEVSIENQILQMTQDYQEKVVFLNGYSKGLARLTNAIGDFIVLPSFFEPCGLEDFISQIFGTLPVAHKTGGLNKILDEKTGFLYEENTSQALCTKLSHVITLKNYAPKKTDVMIKYAYSYIQEKYLWSMVVKNEYLPYFQKLLKNV